MSGGTDKVLIRWARSRAGKTNASERSAADIARGVLAARHALQEHLPVELLHDPSVDMLMSLFVAACDGTQMGTAELATTTTVGPAIATRWIKALVALELIETRGDIVVLTASGRIAVTAALGAVAAADYVRRPRLRMLFGRDQGLARPAAAEPAPLAKIG